MLGTRAIPRYVPHHSTVSPSLPAVFRALSDATRLAVVERLSIGPASATELARPFEMALPSFMQHLGVLEHRCKTVVQVRLQCSGVVGNTKS